MDQKDLNEPLGSATEAIVDTTVNDANQPDEAVETEKSVKTETDEATITETVKETPVESGESSDS